MNVKIVGRHLVEDRTLKNTSVDIWQTINLNVIHVVMASGDQRRSKITNVSH